MKLAALLHVPLDGTETVDKIKVKVRPTLHLLTQPTQTSGPMVNIAASSKAAPATPKPKAAPAGSMTSSPSTMTEVESRMIQLMQQQEQRFQAMMQQVHQHLAQESYNLQDEEMAEEWDAVSPIRELSDFDHHPDYSR